MLTRRIVIVSFAMGFAATVAQAQMQHVRTALDPRFHGMAPAFDCSQPPRRQFRDPSALVREYVRRDTLGLMIEPDVRLLDLVACDLYVSGSEYKVLASLMQIIPATVGLDTARFLLVYHVYGETAEAG